MNKALFSVEITVTDGRTETWAVYSANSVQARYDAEAEFNEANNDPGVGIFYTGRAVPQKCQRCGTLLRESDDSEWECIGCQEASSNDFFWGQGSLRDDDSPGIEDRHDLLLNEY